MMRIVVVSGLYLGPLILGKYRLGGGKATGSFAGSRDTPIRNTVTRFPSAQVFIYRTLGVGSTSLHFANYTFANGTKA